MPCKGERGITANPLANRLAVYGWPPVKFVEAAWLQAVTNLGGVALFFADTLGFHGVPNFTAH